MAGVDLLAAVAVAGFAVRVLRRGSALSSPLPRAGGLLVAVAAALLLVALPLPWVQTADVGRGFATLTASPASSGEGLIAIVLSIAALGAGAYLGRRGGTLAVPITTVVLGAGWCLVALNNLLLIAGANRAEIDRGHLTAGPAVWLCMVGGLAAVAAGAIAARSAQPLASVPTAAPRVRTSVDEWGSPAPPAVNDIGDEW